MFSCLQEPLPPWTVPSIPLKPSSIPGAEQGARGGPWEWRLFLTGAVGWPSSPCPADPTPATGRSAAVRSNRDGPTVDRLSALRQGRWMLRFLCCLHEKSAGTSAAVLCLFPTTGQLALENSQQTHQVVALWRSTQKSPLND